MKEMKKITDLFRRKMDGRLIQADAEDGLSENEVRLSDEKNKKFIVRTLIGITAAGGIILAGAGIHSAVHHDEVTPNLPVESEQMMMTLPSPETEKSLPAEETEFPIPKEEAEKLQKEGADSVRDKIFGSPSPHKVGLTLTLSGITDAEKAANGMETADFLHDAGIFLRDNGVTASRIITESRTETSIPGSFGYEARLQGDGKHLLDFVVLPDFPGEYLFTLTTLPDVPEPETQSEDTAASSGSTQSSAGGSIDQTGQEGQTAQATQSGQSTQPAENSDYDATDLSVESVPQKLLNYLDSPYTFQFKLYDFLYSKGRRGQMSASVSDFSVDGAKKEATIHLTLSDGGSVTAVYSKDSNAWSFS
jgi:hypothetical protein